MNTTLEGKLIPISQINAPEAFERGKKSLVEDDSLRKSIEKSGIQQPLIVFADGNGKYSLVDGFRRLDIARHLELKSVPCVVDQLPADADPKEYQNRLRFILDEHRQDLLHSQRAALIKQLMIMFNMTQKQVAAYFGVEPGSITNWLSIDKYIPPVSKALDSGEITMYAARSFDGMTEDGQRAVWKNHRKELATQNAAVVHQIIRTKYHPSKFPEYYIAPEKTTNQLARKSKSRKAKPREISRSEKQVLLKDLELQDTELKHSKAELSRFEDEINLAAKILRPIVQDDALLALIPDEMLPEIERFSEVYI